VAKKQMCAFFGTLLFCAVGLSFHFILPAVSFLCMKPNGLAMRSAGF